MTQAHSTFLFTCRLLLLTLSCVGLAAWADDYSDIQQLQRLGQYAQALDKAEAYLRTKPRDAQMRFIKGVLQHGAGQKEQAQVTFTQLTQDYPELPEPYNNLAVLYAEQNQLDMARGALEMALRNKPDYTAAHENLGDVYVRLAEQSYRKAAQLAPPGALLQSKLKLAQQLLAESVPSRSP